MKKTVNEIVSVLTDEQQQVLKDCIKYGSWGDGDYEFVDENGKIETGRMWGYYTNNAKDGGHFTGRKVSGLFRGIYNRLCSKEYGNKIGEVISHCTNWWGDGSGDMLFIRNECVDEFENWARQ